MNKAKYLSHLHIKESLLIALKEQNAQYIWLDHYPDNVNWFSKFEHKSLTDMINDACAEYADHPCLDFMGQKYTYRETEQMINRFAKGLQDLGVIKGTRVGLLLPNVPYYIFAYFGALKIGATLINFNPLYAEKELHHQLEDSECEYIVTLDAKLIMDKLPCLLKTKQLKKIIVCQMQDLLSFFKRTFISLFGSKQLSPIPKHEKYLCIKDLIDNEGDYQPVQISPATDVALIQYTGGTTGTPKGAMLTHENLYANTKQAELWFEGIEKGYERMLGVIPLFHVFAMTGVMNLGLKIGAEITLLAKFDVKEVLEVINSHKITLFPAVPTIFNAILHEKTLSHYDISSLKMCISGGAPLAMETKAEFEHITGCKLVEGYGLSETSPVAAINPIFGINKSGSVGLPLPQTIIEIIDPDDQKTIKPIYEKGEICIRGPQVMKGYWKNEKETDQVLIDGTFHTGDIGYMDEDGYIFIVDRIKDLIIAGGYNIYPRHVEEAIYLHPSVKECIVAGIPDEYRGQTVKAYIVLKDGTSLTDKELKQFLKDKLSPIEVPKIVEFRTDLPKTMIGKLSRKDVLASEK